MAEVIVKLDIDRALKEIQKGFAPSVVNIAGAIRDQSRRNIQQNDQVDTGFMRQSNYYVVNYAGTQKSTYDETWDNGAYPSGRHPGINKDREIAPEHHPTETGAIVTGAVYAIDQELLQSFLWQAAEDVRQRGLEGLVEPI